MEGGIFCGSQFQYIKDNWPDIYELMPDRVYDIIELAQIIDILKS